MRVLAVLLILGACDQPALETRETENPSVPVEVLFRQDGCTVYRFEDGGSKHYFARCAASHAETMYRVPSGKTSRPENISTEAP